MSDEAANYWLVFWTAALTIATFALALVAVLGDVIRAYFFKTKLKIELESVYGEKTETTTKLNVRYYRLVVTNEALVTKATQVQVHLLRVDVMVNGSAHSVWESEVPLRWMHAEFKPPTATVGPKAIVDLFHVIEGDGLTLLPAFMPNNLEGVARYLQGKPAHVVLTVEARGAEGSSPRTRIAIDWNGTWQVGRAEMADALRVRLTTA